MGQGYVLEWYREHGRWCSAIEAARYFDMTLRNMQRNLSKLARDGVLEKEVRGAHGEFWYRYINQNRDNSSLGLAAQESQDSEATG